MQIETPDWLACLAYAYCFYKTANNAQPEQCLPATGAPPLPSIPSFLVSLYCCCTNGMAAWHRCAMFHSAAAQPRRLKVPRKVDYAISISICGLIFNIQLSCVCVCVERSRWCKHRFITPIKMDSHQTVRRMRHISIAIAVVLANTNEI